MNFLQLHNILVTNLLHDVYLIDQRFPPFGLRQKILFGKSLNGEFLPSFLILHQINSGERSLADHFDGIEPYVEVTLDEDLTKVLFPLIELFRFLNDKITVLEVFDEPDAVSGSAIHFLL